MSLQQLWSLQPAVKASAERSPNTPVSSYLQQFTNNRLEEAQEKYPANADFQSIHPVNATITFKQLDRFIVTLRSFWDKAENKQPAAVIEKAPVELAEEQPAISAA